MFHEYPRLLQEHYIRRMRETYRRRSEVLKGVRTAAQARRYRDGVGRAIRECFGPLPSRNPLNARVTRTTDFGAFRVEHVLYESRPGFLVTANLFLPRNIESPVPGVLFACGHSHNGKAWIRYAKSCVRLATAGLAALIYDPINQGERDLYSLLRVKDRPTRANPCQGHNMVGKQLRACGDWFGAWRVWDGIRGADYMQTRGEIDSSRLGVAGQSGGGTLSAYLFAMDRRLKAVVSSCWTTSCLLDIENSMPTDNEQCPPGFLRRGLDKIDYFISGAPRAVCLLGQERDFFDDRGLKAGYAELRRIHALLGGDPALCRLSMDVIDHTFRDECQIAMVEFFRRAMGKGGRGAAGSASARIRIPGTRTSVSMSRLDTALDDERIWQVTPLRDVNRFGSTPMYRLVAREARRIEAARRPVASAALPGLARKVLGVRIPGGTPHHRRLFHTGTQRKATGQNVYRFIVESEPGIQCVLRRVCRGGMPYRLDPGEEARLYLPNVSSEADLGDGATMRGVKDFWMMDVRGMGEGLIGERDPWQGYGHEYMMNAHALMYGESLLADRVFDALSAVRLLRAEGARRVHLIGRGQGAILAMLAGVLDREIATVRSLGAPESIRAMVCEPLNDWPDANFPQGILRHFDLPDVRRALGKRLTADTRGDPGRFGA